MEKHNQEIYAVCKKDVEGVFTPSFKEGFSYKGALIKLGNETSNFIYVIFDDNGYSFSFYANSESESMRNFIKLFIPISKKEYEKNKILERFVI
ncbi:MAG: hypothetical protein WCI92_00635 [Bacteroidota bacterium]